MKTEEEKQKQKDIIKTTENMINALLTDDIKKTENMRIVLNKQIEEYLYPKS